MTFSTYFSPGVALQGGGGSGGGGAASLPISGDGATITASTPLIDGTQTWNNAAVTFTGAKLNITDTASNAASLLMDLGTGGGSFVSRFRVGKDSRLFINNSTAVATLAPSGFVTINPSGSGTIRFASEFSAFNVQMGGASTILSASTNVLIAGGGLRINGNSSGTGPNVDLGARAAANLRLGEADTTGTTAPTPQFLSAQSWASSTTNNQTGANFTIDGSQGTGTGAGGSIIFRVAPAGATANGVQNALATAMTIASNKNVTFAGDVLTDYVRAGGFVQAGLYYVNGTNVVLDSSATGVLRFTNAAQNDFSRVQFGGTTSSFPALKRSTTTLQARLADDSAFTNIQGKLTTETAYTAGTVVATGYLTLYDSTGTAYRVPCLV